MDDDQIKNTLKDLANQRRLNEIAIATYEAKMKRYQQQATVTQLVAYLMLWSATAPLRELANELAPTNLK